MAPLAERSPALGLRYTAAHLDDLVALATKRRWSPTQLLEHLVERRAAGAHPPQPRTPPGSAAASAASPP